MNARTALLGLFVALTIVFGSTVVYESGTRSTVTSTVTTTSTLSEASSAASTQTSTVTSIGTATSAIVPALSQDPSIAITSTNMIVATPDGFIIYDATVLNNSTEAVDNITMVFQNHTYHSHATIQNTLPPGKSTTFTFDYYSNTVTTEPPPLHVVLIYGTYQDNQPFAFIETIELAWDNGAPI